MPLNWAKDVNESIGLSPISTDTKSTIHVEKPTAKAPVVPTLPAAYGPHDLSALCSGTQNPWSTLSHCHHQHHRSQSPCDLSTPSSPPAGDCPHVITMSPVCHNVPPANTGPPSGHATQFCQPFPHQCHESSPQEHSTHPCGRHHCHHRYWLQPSHSHGHPHVFCICHAFEPLPLVSSFWRRFRRF